MVYVILLNLQVILFFIYLIVKRFKKVFMRRLIMSSIVDYRTIIISNILNKFANYKKLRVVKGWLT